MKKNAKTIITVGLFLLVVVILVGCVFIDKNRNNREASVSTDSTDFYSVNNLINNKYISVIKNDAASVYLSKSFQSKDIIKISDGKVYAVSDLKNFDFRLVENIKGTPKCVFVNDSNELAKTILYVLTSEGDLYFAGTDNTLVVSSFVKINDRIIEDIYKFYGDMDYPWENNVIYAKIKSSGLVKVKDNIVLKTTFSNDYPYVDRICSHYDDVSCVGVYINPLKEAYILSITGGYSEILYNNRRIIVKDGFSVLPGIVENKVFDNDIYYYLIDKNDSIYKVTQSPDEKIKSVVLYKNVKVKSYIYDEDKKIVNIVYQDGSSEIVKEVHSMSTLYYRK